MYIKLNCCRGEVNALLGGEEKKNGKYFEDQKCICSASTLAMASLPQLT